MVATTPSVKQTPWYIRLDLLTLIPSLLLALVMVWSVVQSIGNANWANGLQVLVSVALPGVVAGALFARLQWLPGWLAHTLAAALGVAWSVQRVGPLLVNEIGRELNPVLAERLVTWADKASEILIRAIAWGRILQAGGRGEDIVLFIVALALLAWALGYTTSWLLFRSGWTWMAVVLNAMMILTNYTFAFPKPSTLFFIFLGTALLLIVQQQVVQHQRSWQAALVEYPAFMPWRFLLAAALFCAGVVLVTSLLPGQVSNTQVARAWQVMSSPLTAARESWENAFSTINAPPGTTGGGFTTRSVRAGGPRSLGDAVVMRVRSTRYDYWRMNAFDRYTGGGWQNTVGERARAALGTATVEEARAQIDPNTPLPQIRPAARALVTMTVELVQPRNDQLVAVGGQMLSAGLPTLVQSGYLVDGGQNLPNYEETSYIAAQLPLQEGQSYTVTALISTADEQSLREAGAEYPEWVRASYGQLPTSVTDRTRARAREIVQQANATNPYDQATALQNALRAFVYDERRAAPPERSDWVDAFLFERQRGYCDDFATAFVVLARSLDIPARWVQGYAGGNSDPQSGGAYIVRESIAHSWPEVYFPGYGWQRFEPTPASYASAPVRPAQPRTDGSDTSDLPLSLGGSSDLDDLREELERQRLEERNQGVPTGQAPAASNGWFNWLGIVVALLGGVGLFIFWMRRQERGLSPAGRAYLRLGRLAGWAGLPQGEHVTPHEYAGELRRALPDQRNAVDQIVNTYVAEQYRRADPHDDAALDQAWTSMRGPLLGRLLGRLGGQGRPRRDKR